MDLRQHFRCPRCQAEACAAELIPTQKTLAAVPVESVRPSAGVPPPEWAPSVAALRPSPPRPAPPPDWTPNVAALRPAPPQSAPPLPAPPPDWAPNLAALRPAPPQPAPPQHVAFQGSPPAALPSPVQLAPVQVPPTSNLAQPRPPEPQPTPPVPSAPWAFASPAGPAQPAASSSAPAVDIAPGAGLEDFGDDERVLELARSSWLLKAARAVLGVAEWFDAFTYGHRLTVLYVLSGIYCLTALLSAVLGQLVWEKVALSAFFVVLLVYGLARLSMFRTEDGRWTWRTALQGLRGGWSRTWDWVRDYRELPPEERQDTVASLAVMLGCFAIALRAGIFWVIAPKGSMVFTVWAGAGWLAIAYGLYQLYQLRNLRKAVPALPPAEQAGAVVRAASGDLPPVIDLVRNSELELQRARSHYGPYIAQLLEVLASWNPKPRGEPIEADYQASLHRHLRKKNPALRVERERPLKSESEGTRRRIDLAIDDCVVIEMKKSIRRTAEADRAFQQVRAYAKEWKDKGPVFLVLCETTSEFAGVLDLQGKIQELRANNYNVVAVAAGRRASA